MNVFVTATNVKDVYDLLVGPFKLSELLWFDGNLRYKYIYSLLLAVFQVALYLFACTTYDSVETINIDSKDKQTL